MAQGSLPQLPQLPQLNLRRVILGTLVIAGVILLFGLLFRFYQVLFILFVALVISIGINPLVEWFNERGLPRPVSAGLVFFLLLVLLAVIVYLGAPLIANQVTNIGGMLPDMYHNLREELLDSPNLFIWRLATEMPDSLTIMPTATPPAPAPTPGVEPEPTETTTPTFTQVREYVDLVLSAVFGIVVTLVLAFYWTLDGEKAKRALLLFVSLEKRESTRELINTMERKVGNYVVGQTLLCVIIGALALVAYLLIGVPYALVMAVFAGIMEAVPVIGPVAGAVPAVLVTFSSDPTKALWVVVATIIIQQLENNLLVPRIMKRAVGVNPLVTLLALLAFSSLFGVIGAVVAIPMAAIIQLLLERYLLTLEPTESEMSDGRDHLSVLRYQTQELMRDVRKQVRYKEAVASADSDQVEDSLEAIATDLDSLLAQVSSAGEAG